MVDELLSAEKGLIKTRFLIRRENVFCHEGSFTEAGLVENMAQTAAAGIGAKPSTDAKKPPVGFIGGIKNLKIYSYPKVGQEITTTVEVLHEVFEASVVKASVSLKDAVIAECELKIFLIQ
ncbi:MAG: 3-hydroxyacyl-ACP dehydratase [bacterium]